MVSQLPFQGERAAKVMRKGVRRTSTKHGSSYSFSYSYSYSKSSSRGCERSVTIGHMVSQLAISGRAGRESNEEGREEDEYRCAEYEYEARFEAVNPKRVVRAFLLVLILVLEKFVARVRAVNHDRAYGFVIAISGRAGGESNQEGPEKYEYRCAEYEYEYEARFEAVTPKRVVKTFLLVLVLVLEEFVARVRAVNHDRAYGFAIAISGRAGGESNEEGHEEYEG